MVAVPIYKIASPFLLIICVLQIAGCKQSDWAIGQKFYGYASWYDEEENGKDTASMEDFDPLELTAAHRRLPFGTYVKVTRIDTQESTIVRINDRGPYKWKRIIDLTPAAAGKLDMLEVGITQVSVEIIGKDPGLQE